MKMEISDNRIISIFVPESELAERGYDQNNHEAALSLLNHLIDEALLFAESTQDFPAMDMPSRTEVAFIPSQGMYITITLLESQEEKTDGKQTVILEQEASFFVFPDFEDLTLCAAKMPERLRKSGKLYVYNASYVLHLPKSDFSTEDDHQLAASIVAEYATRQVDTTSAVVNEYGKVLFEKEAFLEIARLFPC
ncbi:negative regulator of genetic competence MecA [Brevibacillus brevis]|nr:negative regulator of genetic competence MecA [Brevibacillus brevis]TQK63665.1 negative regulator of genetic competence MecA [Brevibacillus sp. AG162]GEC87989.1 hypothetical protein BBR01nite_03200 [Brevibacillus brevis]VEF89544.1 adaptor protein [Brevibacillus brevis]